jgi:thymidylate kinase
MAINAPHRTLAQSDKFWTLCGLAAKKIRTDNLLDKQAIQAKHRDGLRSLAKSAETESALVNELDALGAPEWSAARLLACSRAGDWRTLEGLAGALVSAWTRQNRLATARTFVESRIARRMAHLCSPLLRHGFSVALVGLDTAGQPTLATRLEASLPAPVRRIAMGRWTGYLIGRFYKSIGRIVIFDRHSLDALAAQPQVLPRDARKWDWALSHVCPEPDLTLVFDLPPEPSHERRHEEDPPPAQHRQEEKEEEEVEDGAAHQVRAWMLEICSWIFSICGISG